MHASALHGHPRPAHDPKMAFEREWVNSLIGSMADAVIGVDADGDIDLYNGATLNLLDQNGSLAGRPVAQVIRLFDKDGEPCSIWELIRSAKTAATSRDYLLHYADGSTANLFLSIAPVYLGFGERGNHGYVLMLRDITKEKSLEEERDEFISVVSHELRTPIAITEGSISNAQFIAGKSGDIKQIQDALNGAYSQILFLSGLVNDLATLSRAERGALQVQVESLNPHQLVEDLVKGYADQAAAKKLLLRTDLDPHLEALRSSPLYVREILHNFITNAIKYTQTGQITVSARAVPGGVAFSVSDTGIGLSRSDQQKLFTKFFRSEDYRTRQNNGTGLGLYITKKLAALLHADISLESQLNHGSTFTLTVPNLPSQH